MVKPNILPFPIITKKKAHFHLLFIKYQNIEALSVYHTESTLSICNVHKKIGRNLHISPKNLLTNTKKGDTILYCIIMGAYAPCGLTAKMIPQNKRECKLNLLLP